MSFSYWLIAVGVVLRVGYIILAWPASAPAPTPDAADTDLDRFIA